MGNHYHLQLESREANLSKALHWLNVSYSMWFNRKYNAVGIAIRRFTQRLQSDHILLEKVALVQKELESR
jgi:hypothetical protein